MESRRASQNHKTLKLEVDELHQLQTTPGSSPVGQQQEPEATMGTDSLKLDRRLEQISSGLFSSLHLSSMFTFDC